MAISDDTSMRKGCGHGTPAGANDRLDLDLNLDLPSGSTSEMTPKRLQSQNIFGLMSMASFQPAEAEVWEICKGPDHVSGTRAKFMGDVNAGWCLANGKSYHMV